MREFSFERLEVYQRGINFIDKAFEISDKLTNRVQYSVGDQFRRASLSIANNIAESSGRKSKKEKLQFLGFAQASAFECVPILTILQRRKYIFQKEFEYMYKECYEISKMLSGLMKSFN